jgi:hypothetical protein
VPPFVIFSVSKCARLNESTPVRQRRVTDLAFSGGRPFVVFGRVGVVVAELELKLVDLEDCEPFSTRHANWEVDDEILRMVDTVDQEPSSVAFGTFHLWQNSDA